MRAHALLVLATLALPLLHAGSATGCLPFVPGESCREAWVVHDHAYLWQLDASPDSRAVYATGGLLRDGRLDVGTVTAHDVATGALLWERRLDVPDGMAWSFGSRVHTLPDGTVLVLSLAGDFHAESGGTVPRLVGLSALDAASGATRWERTFDGRGVYGALAHGVNGDALVLVQMAGKPAFVAAFGSVDGADAWRTELATGSAYLDMSAAGGRVLLGGIATTGTASDPSDALAVGLDAADGSVQWRRTWGGAESRELAPYARLDAAGELAVVGGRTIHPANRTGGWIAVAYDAATGEPRWAHEYASPFGATHWLTGFDVAPDGSRAFLGGIAPSGRPLTWQFTVAAVDGVTGGLAWESHYQGPARWNDILWGLAASPDSTRVYATGESYAAGVVADGNYDWLTTAFDAADGRLAWAARFDGPALGWEQPRAVAVTPDGARVLVVGASVDDAGRRTGLAAYDVAAEEATGASPVSVIGSTPVPPAPPRDDPVPPTARLLPDL